MFGLTINLKVKSNKKVIFDVEKIIEQKLKH